MLVYEKVKPLVGIDLNYEVVGGLTPPTTFNKENTIWIDTVIDKENIARHKATINGVHQDYYIKLSTGVVTKPSSNTCYTKWFPCEEGHEYNFKLSDAQTVVIAHFNVIPNQGATGTVLYGNGNDTGLSELNYTLVAPAGQEFNGESLPHYLGIWYYDSSKNAKMPVLTITDLTEMNNIINEMPDEHEINEHAIAYENPWVHYEDVDHIIDSTIIQGKYLSSSGDVTTGDTNNAPCYTENYIPVKYGTIYKITYFISLKKALWMRICEYTSSITLNSNNVSYTFKTQTTPVNDVTTDVQQTVTYTPSSPDVTHIRLSWRTFSPSGATCKFSFIEKNVQYNIDTTVGNLWIQSDSDNAPISFNAIQRNELMIYPNKVERWDGNDWRSITSSLYQGNTSTQLCTSLPEYTSGLNIWYDGIKNTPEGHDETTSLWYDLSGNGNHAQVELATNKAAWLENGIRFDTYGSKIIIPMDLYTADLTMEFVIKLDKLKNYNTLIAVATSPNSASNGYRGAWIPSSGTAVLRLNSSYDQPDMEVIAGIAANTLTIAFTYSESSSTLRVYVNGNLAGTYTRAKSNHSYQAYYLFACGSDTTRWLQGNAHGFRHYTKVLSQKELKANSDIDKKRFG